MEMTMKAMTLTFHFNQRFWWHICIFGDTQSQKKMQKSHKANIPRQTE